MDYHKLYNALISFRTLNPLKKSNILYTEIHHILPRCFGGSDDPENLIRLTGREHFIAHRLLSKIYPDSIGLACAALFMSRLQNKKICSREYDRLKELVSECSSNGVRSRWGNPSFRDMMTSRFKSQWENQEFKTMMALRSKTQWDDPVYRAKIKEAQLEWYEERKDQPWLMRRSTKEIWGLAQLFWEHRRYNPEAAEIYTVKEFCKIFNEGKYIDTFYKMDGRFKKNGWIPKLDPNWLKEFGHISY